MKTPSQPLVSPRTDPRPAMEQALERAIELSVGKKQYAITHGQLINEHAHRYRYTFLLESSWDLPDGTDIQLRSADVDHLTVELSNTKDTVITIMTTQRLSARTLACASVVIERAHLLRKMKEALSHDQTSVGLGLKLFGAVESTDEMAASSLVDMISAVFVPDEAQRQAIQRSLASDVQIILGPGGTGKTDVLAAIAMLHALVYQHRVLICSHTNIAIDNAILRLAAFFRTYGMESFLEEQQLVRAGNPHLAELETDGYRHVTMSLIVNDWIEQQRQEIARLERRREKVLQRLDTAHAALSEQRRAWEQRKERLSFQCQRIQEQEEALEEEEQRRLAPILAAVHSLEERTTVAVQQMTQAKATVVAENAVLKPLRQTYAHQRIPYETALKRLERLQTYHPLGRIWAQFLTGTREKAVEMELKERAVSLMALEQQMGPIEKRVTEAMEAFQEAHTQHTMLETDLSSWRRKRDSRPAALLSAQAARARERADLEREFQEGHRHIHALEQTVIKRQQERDRMGNTLALLDRQVADAKRDAARKIIESAQIVGATLTGLYLNPTLFHQEWDVVIMDEGSMAPPPAVMIAAQRASAHVIVVGDPLQLAPVCKLKDPLVKPWQGESDRVQLWLGRDVFFHGGYTLQQAGTGIHHSMLLPYQSRMHRDICDLVRGLVYHGLLKDRHPQQPRPTFGPEPEHAVVLYDTGGAPLAQARKPTSGGSRYNIYHAEIAIKLAWQTLADLPPTKKPECIGIVTPYAAQREQIKERVRGTALEIYARIGTVHAFQGLEFDVLIFDTVESPGMRIAPFLCGEWGTDAMRLLNVAVTRARHKLFIVANMDIIRQEPSSFILPQMMELACQKKCVSAASLD